MTTLCRSSRDDCSGVAAIEFALIAPMMLILLGGMADFGLVMTGRSQLANGVAQGVQYALLQGPTVTAANIRTMVQNGSSRAGLVGTVTVTITGPACYCVSGRPAALVTPSMALSASHTCTGTCPSPEVAPGAFVIIAASYVYQPLMPLYSQVASTTLSESVTVRLQ